MLAVTSLNPEQQLDPPGRPQQDLLAELDEFYDAVPRKGARAEDFGPLTLFVREGEGWPFYARPTRGWTGAPAAEEDVRRVLARQRELGLPESFEWVAEHTPGLRTAIERAGLAVHEHPLLVLPEEQGDGPTTEPLPDGVRARVLAADDPALASAVATPNLAFAEPGTALGTAGPAELARAVLQVVADGAVERVAARIGAGAAAVAAVVEDGSALCSGQYQRVGPVCEIVGVGTLPSARRRGLGLAVTSALVADARARGVRTVFLSAADEDVARIYRRAGFRNTATALIAEPKA